MDYKLLGKTGVKVSSLCLGTMTFGDADESVSAKIFHRCREVGINFFDCANVYHQGRSEQILGTLIAGCRSEVIITTKFYGSMGSDINASGSSRRHILLEVDNSLRRLNTDFIDLYFIHHFDEETPIHETLRALDDLVRQGKILYPAVSNYAAWQIVKANGISEQEGLARFECIQPMYNLVKRQVEVEILPMALSEQMGVIPYSPLGGGLLSGKYGVSKRPDSGRLLESQMYQSRYAGKHYYQIAQDFTHLAQQSGYHPAGLAVAWVGAHPAITAPIIGARNTDQLEGSLASLQINMTSDLYASISDLSPRPPLATDREDERTG